MPAALVTTKVLSMTCPAHLTTPKVESVPFSTIKLNPLWLPLFVSLSAIFAASFSFAGENLTSYPAKEYNYKIVKSFPHSVSIFTQGLEYHDGYLYESAGKQGESLALKRRLNSSRISKFTALDKKLFGEGITLLANNLYQLTWKSQRGFVYNPTTLKLQREFSFQGEGWGLSNNGKELILSNGSSVLQFIEPANFTVSHTITVTLNGNPVNFLNELEWVDGFIYANVWTSNWVVIIDPANGNVVAYVNLSDLLPAELTNSHTDVLNGIAYDNKLKRLFVTGKYWPKLYQIELTEKNN